jgi:hypothetical protein
MRSKRGRVLSIGVALLGLVAVTAVASSEASACSRECRAPVRVFERDTQVPANLIRFKVLVAEPGPLELRAADGSVVAASIQVIGNDRVFAPDAPPAPGQHLTLHYQMDCTAPVVGARPDFIPWTLPFVVRGPGDMHLEPTALTVAERGIDYFGGRGPSMFVRYHLLPPDRNGQAHHLTDTTWTIDGRPLSASVANTIRSYCQPAELEWSPDTCGNYGAVPPGKHVLEGVTRIVGVDQQFVSELEVDTSCDQVLRIDPGAGATGTDAGADAVAPERPNGGCVYAAGGPGGGLGLVVAALGWFAIALGRRMRR